MDSDFSTLRDNPCLYYDYNINAVLIFYIHKVTLVNQDFNIKLFMKTTIPLILKLVINRKQEKGYLL